MDPRTLYTSDLIYISLGSNLNPLIHISEALTQLQKKVNVISVSSFYQSPAYESEGPDFVNGACACKTSLSLFEFKHKVLVKIEESLGRERETNKNAPRAMDLDLLLWGREIMYTDEFHIPDSLIYKRSFLSIPLFDIAPDFILPDTGVALSTLVMQHKHQRLVLLKEFSDQIQKQGLIPR